MKHTKLIFLALLGILFFTSCKDDEPIKPAVSAFPTVTKIKALTSVGISSAQTTIEGWGYTNMGADVIDNISIYTFASTSKTDIYMLLVTNNIVFGSSYLNNIERTNALKGFEALSKECIAYMKGKTLNYDAKATLSNDQTTTFTSHESFATYYETNKYEIITGEENWKTIKEVVSSRFAGPDELTPSFKSAVVYIDSEIAPSGFMNKSLVNYLLSPKK